MTKIDVNLEPIKKLTRDLRTAATTLSDDEARYLVDLYYQMQENRMRSASQVREQQKSGEPHEVLSWYKEQAVAMENQIKGALHSYVKSHEIGPWCLETHGIGPVIAAGVIARIDINRAPTAGHIWSYAGLTSGKAWIGGEKAKKSILSFVNPKDSISPQEIIKIAKKMECDPKWLARRVKRRVVDHDIPFYNAPTMDDLTYVSMLLLEHDVKVKHVVDALSKRPWNADLKRICFLAGESFVKFKAAEECFYGHMYEERKRHEIEQNEAGNYAEAAAAGAKRVGKETKAYQSYSKGKLPDGHIHMRALRWTVKLWLSHLHEVWYEKATGKKPVEPYAIAHAGHAHKIEPPHRL